MGVNMATCPGRRTAAPTSLRSLRKLVCVAPPADYEGSVYALALRRIWDTAGELSHPIGLTPPQLRRPF